MAVPYHGGPVPDLYQLLGVARDAPARDITHAWRRKALAAHPDSRPHDADAAARFRVLAEACRVLSDPAQRAAYDRALRRDQPVPGSAAPPAPGPPARAPLLVTYLGGASRTPPAPGLPLRADPVFIDGLYAAPAADRWRGERARLAALAELAACYLGDGDRWGRAW
jgi:curved DNA-binding protein CbpA